MFATSVIAADAGGVASRLGTMVLGLAVFAAVFGGILLLASLFKGRRGEKVQAAAFVGPTLFDEVKPGMRIAQEEIFGPVLAAIPFRDPDHAIEIANGTKYGLGASIWTSDVRRAVEFAKRVEAGVVNVNPGGAAGAVGAPFGGYKHSGFGRSHSSETILEYTQVKSVVINAGS